MFVVSVRPAVGCAPVVVVSPSVCGCCVVVSDVRPPPVWPLAALALPPQSARTPAVTQDQRSALSHTHTHRSAAAVFYLTEALHLLRSCLESQGRGAQSVFLSVQLLSQFLQTVSLSQQRFLLLFQLSGAQLQIRLLLSITPEKCDLITAPSFLIWCHQSLSLVNRSPLTTCGWLYKLILYCTLAVLFFN